MAWFFSDAERRRARIIDAERHARLDEDAARLEESIKAERAHFDLEFACAALGVSNDDRMEVAERAYERAVRRTYRDQQVTPRERAALDWLAARLELSDEHRRAAELRVGAETFETYLDRALEDEEIDRTETAALEQIAAGMGLTVDALVDGYFKARGEQFLRGLFAAILRDGEITEEEWRRLNAAAGGLGLSHERLVELIGGQAERYVARLAAEARRAGTPVTHIRTALGGLLRRLPLSKKFRADLDAELAADL